MKYILSVYLGLIGVSCFGQKPGFTRIFLQDSNHVKANVTWVDYSGGPAITTGPEEMSSFIFSPTLDVVMIDKNYHLFKMKASYRQGVSFFSNFSQSSIEFSLMTGRIAKERQHSFEAYIGLGVISGAKQVTTISSGSGGGAGFSGFGLGSTTYSRKDFVTVGIPIELKVQWKYIGIGLDANLNLYLPYIGPKLFLKLGNKYLANGS